MNMTASIPVHVAALSLNHSLNTAILINFSTKATYFHDLDVCISRLRPGKSAVRASSNISADGTEPMRVISRTMVTVSNGVGAIVVGVGTGAWVGAGSMKKTTDEA